MTPIREPLQWPWRTHAGEGVWHTLCEICGERCSGEGPGGATSAHAAHVTRTHGRD